MFKFRVFDLLAATWELEASQELADKQRATAGELVPNKILDSDQRSYQEAVDLMRAQCKRFELQSALDQLDRIDATLKYGSLYGSYSTFTSQVQQVWECLKTDLDRHVFMYMPQAQSKYYEREELFGSDVKKKFPKAIEEIQAAGNCYATGNFTACVFHLMRALETALHVLAADLSVTFPATIELENWQNIIDKIEKAVRDKEQSLPKGVQKSEEMQYYSEAAKEFRYFKLAWRNHVSHSRVDYDIHDATKIMEHVRDFMQHLATRLKE